MSLVTLEIIEARQAELGKLIQQFKDQTTVRQIEIDGRTIELQVGERYAGAKLDAQGNHLHDVIVLAARPAKKQDWAAVQAWAKEQGAEAPSPEEFALIKANCADLLTESVYWTAKEYEGNASYAWLFTSDGSTGSLRKSAELSALAVRRV